MTIKKVEDEIKYRELIKNPLRVFGYSYIYFLLVILAVGIIYVNNITNISFNKIPVSFIDSLNIERDITQKKGSALPPVDLKAELNPTINRINTGKELYDANCQSCHGNEGAGDGPAAAALNPPARNLRSSEGWTNGMKFNDLYKTLHYGIIKNGMAAYEYLTPSDRIALIHYIRTFSESYPAFTIESVAAELDAEYNISAGTKVPNQIPVRRAKEIFISEQKNLTSKAAQIVQNINGSEYGAKLLMQYSYLPEKTMGIFIYNGVPGSLNDFIKIISSNPRAFEFESKVINLPQSDWKLLFDFIKRTAV